MDSCYFNVRLAVMRCQSLAHCQSYNMCNITFVVLLRTIGGRSSAKWSFLTGSLQIFRNWLSMESHLVVKSYVYQQCIV